MIKKPQLPKLKKDDIVHADFFEECITILRDEGYSSQWIKLRSKLFEVSKMLRVKPSVFKPLPQAIETTEILNEVKADKGILTEEELKERNRLLVLENDEQTAEIIMLRELQKSSDEILGDYVEKVEQQNEEICRLQDEISTLRGENNHE